MKALIARFRVFWQGRNARERRLLIVMTAVVGLGLLWALHDWQAGERARLAIALPAAQAQLKTMQDDAAELARVRAAPRAGNTDNARRLAALQALASGRNLVLTLRNEGDVLLVSGDNLAFDLWVNWLGQAQTSERLRLQNLDVTRSGPGVRVEARLVPAR